MEDPQGKLQLCSGHSWHSGLVRPTRAMKSGSAASLRARGPAIKEPALKIPEPGARDPRHLEREAAPGRHSLPLELTLPGKLGMLNMSCL